MSTLQKDHIAPPRGRELQELRRTEQICNGILRLDPVHPDALHLLGMVTHRQGRSAEALDAVRRAIAVPADKAGPTTGVRDTLRELDRAVKLYRKSIENDPASADVYYHLGMERLEAGEFVEAAAGFEHALSVRPDWLDAAEKLSEAYLHGEKPDRAIHILEQLTVLSPTRKSARLLLAECRLKQGELAEAAQQFEAAIGIDDKDADLHYRLGRTQLLRGDLRRAEECLGIALALDPDHKAAWNDRGAALLNMGRTEDARRHFEEALTRDPQDPDALGNLGLVYLLANELNASAEICRRAIQSNPANAFANNILGNVLRAQGKLQEAVQAFQQALQVNAAYTEAHNNLALSYHSQGQVEEAVSHYRRAMELRTDCTTSHSNLLHSMHYLPDNDLDAHFREHLNWAEAHGQFELPTEYSNTPALERKLRVGYVSPDFRRHPVGLFIEPILAGHDPAQIETYCYSGAATPDEVTRGIENRVHCFRVINWLNNDEIAKQIAADGIDILVDLAGHTANNRLTVFARKPAPIQMSYLGYGGTTGLKAVDYRLTDEIADPSGEPCRHSEQLIRLKSGLLCYAPESDLPTVQPPPALANGYVTFGSFNNPTKVNERTAEVWARLMHELPNARLILKYPSLGDSGTSDRCMRLFTAHGISRDRIKILGGKRPRADHFAAYGEIDIMLDTFPYSGSTTTCESLWMGVPVIALRGQSYVGRISAGILSTIGIRELITESTDEYIQRALQLAASTDQLAAIRSSLRKTMQASPLCDSAAYTHEIETVYRDVWRQWCQEQQ